MIYDYPERLSCFIASQHIITRETYSLNMLISGEGDDTLKDVISDTKCADPRFVSGVYYRMTLRLNISTRKDQTDFFRPASTSLTTTRTHSICKA